MATSNLTAEEVLNFDLDKYYAEKKLRKDRPWVYDIIRVLWGRPAGVALRTLDRELWDLRNPVGLPMPSAFSETIRATIYDHSSDAAGWNGNAEDDLFFKTRRGVWAVRRQHVPGWLERHDLPKA